MDGWLGWAACFYNSDCGSDSDSGSGCGSRVGFGSDAGLDVVLGPDSDSDCASGSDSDFADRACGARRVRR